VADDPAYRYRAVATDAAGNEVAEIFESNVEYLPGDELPLRSARWRVDTAGPEMVVRHGADEQRLRELRCHLA
jgi:hypothetical protein